MNSDWPRVSIADCASKEPYSTQIGPFGDKIRAETYQPVGIPVLRGTNLKLGRFYDGDFVFINEEKADELKIFECQSDDVILVHKGTVGKVGIIPKSLKHPRYIMGNSMMRVRCDKNKLQPLFLYYWLYSEEGQHYLNSRLSQVGVPQIQQPLTTLRQAIIPCPPLPIQEQITQILGSLDDKIELNRQMNETLETMARAIFQSWFVDFYPVRAKTEGHDTGLPPEIAALFPDGFEEVEGREVPRGWRVSKIGAELTTILGGTPSRDISDYWQNGNIPWINSGKANEFRVLEPSEYITRLGMENSATKLLPERTTIIAITGATLGQVSLLEISACANQSIVGVLGTKKIPNEFVYFWIKTNIEDLVACQTGGAQQHINKNDVNDLEFLLPHTLVLEAYLLLTKPFFDLIKTNCIATLMLAKIRDALLPKLMSGEIQVDVKL
jgi:type I restriction enzyme S subunit